MDIFPPTHEAAWIGDETEVARLVAEDGRRLNQQIQQGPWQGCTPLMMAADMGWEAVVSRLLALGADVRPRDRWGRTAAHLACSGDGSGPALALLLDHGAPLNLFDDYERYTPLMTAASAGATACVAVLL